MGIVGYTELAVIGASRRFGEAPTYVRQFVVEVDDPTTTTAVITNAPGVSFLQQHPEAYYLRAFDVRVSNYNGSRWHYLVEWTYQLPKQQNVQLHPLARPDIWKFATSGMAVPALTYYEGNGNGNVLPLVNTAYDYFEGIQTDLSCLDVHISGNRATFDYRKALEVQNAVNKLPYLTGDQYTWKCEGISGQPAVEVFNEQEVRFWQVEVVLKYRPDGWPLQLPNVGWNYLDAGKKKRVYVVDPDSGDKVPSSNPQALDSSGGLKLLSYGAPSEPDILIRRTSPEVDFASYFGTPPE
jgi:hypothetical protein